MHCSFSGTDFSSQRQHLFYFWTAPLSIHKCICWHIYQLILLEYSTVFRTQARSIRSVLVDVQQEHMGYGWSHWQELHRSVLPTPKLLPDKQLWVCLSISVCSAQWIARCEDGVHSKTCSRCEDGVYSKSRPRYSRRYPWPSALKWAKLALEQLSCDLAKPSPLLFLFF